jgi:hypothetical protein
MLFGSLGYGTVMRNASTVEVPDPTELSTFTTAFPAAAALPPIDPVIVCEYVLPGATALTGPLVSKAPPLLNTKFQSTKKTWFVTVGRLDFTRVEILELFSASNEPMLQSMKFRHALVNLT